MEHTLKLFTLCLSAFSYSSPTENAHVSKHVSVFHIQHDCLVKYGVVNMVTGFLLSAKGGVWVSMEYLKMNAC